jgi:hypothetical protein
VIADLMEISLHHEGRVVKIKVAGVNSSDLYPIWLPTLGTLCKVG